MKIHCTSPEPRACANSDTSADLGVRSSETFTVVTDQVPLGAVTCSRSRWRCQIDHRALRQRPNQSRQSRQTGTASGMRWTTARPRYWSASSVNMIWPTTVGSRLIGRMIFHCDARWHYPAYPRHRPSSIRPYGGPSGSRHQRPGCPADVSNAAIGADVQSPGWSIHGQDELRS